MDPKKRYSFRKRPPGTSFLSFLRRKQDFPYEIRDKIKEKLPIQIRNLKFSTAFKFQAILIVSGILTYKTLWSI